MARFLVGERSCTRDLDKTGFGISFRDSVMETHHRVTFYGILQERIATELFLNVTLKNVSEMRSYLEENYTILRNIPYLVAINRTISSPDSTITQRDEIAILPPFSGG
jgi:molybdopterin synthase sulfur carrier subunit